jgi:hypothetical protein
MYTDKITTHLKELASTLLEEEKEEEKRKKIRKRK